MRDQGAQGHVKMSHSFCTNIEKNLNLCHIWVILMTRGWADSDSARNFEYSLLQLRLFSAHQVMWVSTTTMATFTLLIASKRSSNIKASR